MATRTPLRAMTAVQALCKTMKTKLVTVRSHVRLLSGAVVAGSVEIGEVVLRAICSSAYRRIRMRVEGR
jgi:hypothetical protein